MTPAPEQVPTTILSHTACRLGEGPTYDAASDTAWWFDILEKTLFEHRFGAGDTIRHPLPFMASQLSFIDDARQLVASQTGLHVRDIATGGLSLLSPIEADDPATRSNDGRVHPSGALWIGTMGRNAEPGAGAIYWFRAGETRRLYADVTIPNAICFAPDGRTAYFVDSHEGLLLRVETDPETGLPLGEPVPFHDHRGQAGDLDGAVVDGEGRLWNARWGAGCVDVYGPDGQRLRTIAVAARQPTCPIFVGRTFDRLLVTSARQGLDADALQADPQAGKTFLLDVSARGRPEPRVAIA